MMMCKFFLSASSSRWLGGILILDSHMPSVRRVLWVAGGRRTVASELASSKWLLPQIDLHRWEEVFQVGTGTTPDREGRQREGRNQGGPGKEAWRSPSRAQPWVGIWRRTASNWAQAYHRATSEHDWKTSPLSAHRPCTPPHSPTLHATSTQKKS